MTGFAIPLPHPLLDSGSHADAVPRAPSAALANALLLLVWKDGTATTKAGKARHSAEERAEELLAMGQVHSLGAEGLVEFA